MLKEIKNKELQMGRTRRLLSNVFGALLSRIVNLGSSLVIVPLAVKGLGTHQYGIFAIILSSTIIFSYSDLGLGLAVVNRLAALKNEADFAQARNCISNVWYFLLRASTVLLIVGIVIIAGLKVSGASSHESELDAWLVLVVCVAAGLAPGLTQRVLFGLQRNLEANLWNTSGRIFSVLGVYLAYFTHASMPWFILAMLGLPAILGWLNTLLLWRGTPWLRPDKSIVSWGSLKGYAFEGLQFLFLQVGIFFETGVDNIFIGIIQGTQYVTNYDMLARLFIYVPALISMLAFPLWPAIGQAKASGDNEWVRRAVKLTFFGVGAVSIVTSSVFLCMHVEIIRTWTGVKYTPNFGLATALAAFSVLTSIGTVQAMLMSGLGFISTQIRMMLIFLVVLIPLKIFALIFSGQTLMVWALVLVYTLRIFSILFYTKKNNIYGF